MIKRAPESKVFFSVKENHFENWKAWLLGGIIISAFIICYAQVFVIMAGQWWTNDMYSYGFLIPGISLYLIWIRRDRLNLISPAPGYIAGFALFLPGLALLLFGQAGGVITLQEISLIITLYGIVLLLFGSRFFQVLWLPLIYLLFMIPVWDFFTDRLHFPFQLFSATLGTNLLSLIGIPAFQQGKYIQLPNITLEVAKACSGVNYLVAVVVIGIPMAYLFLKGMFRRILLVGFAIIVAILSNGLRIALIGLLSYFGIAGDDHGPFHILQGLFVSVIGYGAIFGGIIIISKIPSFPSKAVNSISSIPSKGDIENNSNKLLFPMVKRGRFNKISFLGGFVSLLLVLTGSYHYYLHPVSVPLKSDIQSFPAEIGIWKSSANQLDNPVYRGKGADDELFRSYSTASKEGISLYIEYYRVQDKEKVLTDYRINELYQEASKLKLNLAIDGAGTIEINRVIQNQNGRSRQVLFWYELNGKVFANRYMAKFVTTWNGLIQGRTNGAMIMVTSDYYSQSDLEKSLSHNEEFVKDILPLLADILPSSR